MTYCVYVLRSVKDGNLYIGCTNDLPRRLAEHNNGRVRSTKGRRPLTLEFLEEFQDKYTAFNTEHLYKTPAGKKMLLQKMEQFRK